MIPAPVTRWFGLWLVLAFVATGCTAADDSPADAVTGPLDAVVTPGTSADAVADGVADADAPKTWETNFEPHRETRGNIRITSYNVCYTKLLRRAASKASPDVTSTPPPRDTIV